MAVAETLLRMSLLYLICGLLFGVAFVTAGVGRVDPAARGTSVWFRLLILPGTAALWPLVAVRWVQCTKRS